jgi:hypothetical protein
MPAPRSNRQQDLNLTRRIALTAAAGLLATAAIAQMGLFQSPHSRGSLSENSLVVRSLLLLPDRSVSRSRSDIASDARGLLLGRGKVSTNRTSVFWRYF